MYFLYSVLTAAGVILLSPYFLVQGLRRGKYLHSLRERLGFLPPEVASSAAQDTGAIWIHAVSVGEALAALPLAQALKQRFPDRRLVVSTTTATGQRVARERMNMANAVFYFPLDWAGPVRRVFGAVNPALVVILETEIWPNFLREAARHGVPVIFVSGRISDRSFERYKKWLGVFGFFLRPFLRQTLSSVTAFLMQSEKDAERIRTLGAPADRVRVSGNLKYDLDLPASTPLANWLEREARRRGRGPVIVAGSIVAGEEPLALIAFGTLQGEHPHALLVLAPRKPERFDAAAEFIDESHRKYIRRSQLRIPTAATVNSQNGEPSIADDVTVLLLDSIGELASLYRLADGALVGGSLVPSGGHNILEPAAFGKIPVFGPHMENFSDIAKNFVGAGAAIQVESPEDAGVAWIELLRNPQRMHKMGETALAIIEKNRGATDRAVSEIAKHMPAAGSGA